MISRRGAALMTLAVGFLFLGYSNCSDVRMSPFPSENPQDFSISTSRICAAGDAVVRRDEFNAVIIIDMSGSNIYSNWKSAYPVAYTYTYDAAGATDSAGLRLLAIKKFVETNPKARIKIIPFASDVTFSGRPEFVCDSGFTQGDATLPLVESLIQWQKDEIINLESNTNDYRVFGKNAEMTQTNYLAALECSLTAIKKEYESIKVLDLQTMNYKLLFVTDGKPYVKGIFEVQDLNSDKIPLLVNKVKEISLYASLAASFQMIPVYYGLKGTTEFDLAMGILKLMGAAGLWINTQNPQDMGAPLFIEDVNSLDLTGIYKANLFEPSRIVEFNVVNLTAKPRNGVLEADSNMNGIPDSLEEGQVGGTGDTSTSSSSESSLSPLLRIPLAQDEDGDLIPDAIEEFFGTSKNTSDAFLDYDNDGVTNMDEIHEGESPTSPIRLIDPTRRIQVIRHLDTENPCAANQETWSIDSLRLPLVDGVKAYSVPDGVGADLPYREDLSHGEGENVFVAYFYSQPETYNSGTRKLFAHFFKFKKGDPQPSFSEKDFVLLGRVSIPGAGASGGGE